LRGKAHMLCGRCCNLQLGIVKFLARRGLRPGRAGSPLPAAEPGGREYVRRRTNGARSDLPSPSYGKAGAPCLTNHSQPPTVLQRTKT